MTLKKRQQKKGTKSSKKSFASPVNKEHWLIRHIKISGIFIIIMLVLTVVFFMKSSSIDRESLCWKDYCGGTITYLTSKTTKNQNTPLSTIETTITTLENINCSPFFDENEKCILYERITKRTGSSAIKERFISLKDPPTEFFSYKGKLFYISDFMDEIVDSCQNQVSKEFRKKGIVFRLQKKRNKKIKAGVISAKCCELELSASDFTFNFCISFELCNTILESEEITPFEIKNIQLTGYS